MKLNPVFSIVSRPTLNASCALILAASPAFGQDTPMCGGYADMAAVLAEKYGEYLVFQGPTESGSAVLEIFARPDGTWTALIVGPDGAACIFAAGQMWIGFDVPQGQEG